MANDIVLMNDHNQRIDMEKLYNGEEVPISFIEIVSYVVTHYSTLIRTRFKIIIYFQVVKSESFFGFCHLKANNHWIAIVSYFCT